MTDNDLPLIAVPRHQLTEPELDGSLGLTRRSILAACLLAVYMVVGALVTLRHIGYVLAIQPRWQELSDDEPCWIWFAGAAMASKLLHWCVLGDLSFCQALAVGALYLGMTISVFEREGRSSLLLFAVWAASAGVDLVACAAEVAGIALGAGLRSVTLPAELAYCLLLSTDFIRQPAAIRAAGYRRRAAVR